jgi:hypothetical protein
MSRLQDELKKRAEPRPYTEAEQEIRKRFEADKKNLRAIQAHKGFQKYLQIEEEMNDPRLVIAHKCSDPTCESMKAKIRDFQKRKQMLAKVLEGQDA